MKQLYPTGSEELWRLAAITLRAAATPFDRPLDASLSHGIASACGESDPRRWAEALRSLAPEQSDDSVGRKTISAGRSPLISGRWIPSEDTINGHDAADEAPARDAATPNEIFAAREALLDAADRLAGRQLAADRFASAVREGVERAMYNFAYGLSHELNNPLANISARAEQFAKSATDESTRRSAATIVQQCMRAHEMLAEMMLAVRPAAVRSTRLDLRELAEQAAEDFAAQAEEFNLSFEADIDARRLPIGGDADALRHVWQAVFDNAVEASSPGQTVHMFCQRSDEPDDAGGEPQVRWAMVDNGRGMTPEQIERAFDLYYCGREAGRSLGVGLSKVRRVVQLHGGRVWLESLPRVGTALEMRFPWQAS